MEIDFLVPVQSGGLHKTGLWNKLCRDIEGETSCIICLYLVLSVFVSVLHSYIWDVLSSILKPQMQTNLTTGADSCQLPDKKSILF